MSEKYSNIPENNSLDSMEGIDNKLKKPEVEYGLNPDSFFEKIKENIGTIIEEFEGKSIIDANEEIERSLNKIGRSLQRNDQKILKPPESKEENDKLLEVIRWLHDEFGVNPTQFNYGVAMRLDMHYYRKEELLDIIDSSIGGKIEAAIFNNAGDIILNGKTNEEIVKFVTDLIKRRSLEGMKPGEDEQGRYRSYSAHSGDTIWKGAIKFITLDNNLEKTLEIGENLGDEFVWEKILNEKREEIEILSKEKKYEIAVQAVKSIRKKRNMTLYNDKLNIKENYRGVFGGILMRKIEELLS